MLMSFTVSNFGPYRDPETLMMMPGSIRSRQDHVHNGLLRHALVFGPNASGKSSLIEAISVMKGLCTDPLYHVDGPISNWHSEDDVTRFEIRFTHREVEYRYGLDVEPNSHEGMNPLTFRTVGERLFVTMPGSLDETLVFERNPARADDGGKIGRLLSSDRELRSTLSDLYRRRDMARVEVGEFDPESEDSGTIAPMAGGETMDDLENRIAETTSAMEANLSVLKSLIRSSGTVPAILADEQHPIGISYGDMEPEDAAEHMRTVCEWMTSSLMVIGSGSQFTDLEAASALLESLDLGADGLVWRRVGCRKAFETVGLLNVDDRIRLESMIHESARGGFSAHFDVATDGGICRLATCNGREPEVLELCLRENECVWPLSCESYGTRRIVAALPMLVPSETGITFVVDEIDGGIHWMFVRRLVELFDTLQHRCCQLIATTHDTALMSTALFRRDEMWVIERTGRGSHLISLDECPWNWSEPLETAYLNGRLPGVPRISETEHEGS